MANNVDILDGNTLATKLKSTESGGIHTIHHNVDTSALPTGAATEATLATTAASNAVMDAVAGATPTGRFILGIRKDSDASPISADGDFHPFVFNSIGRLKISMLPGDLNAVTGNITAVAQTLYMDVKRAGTAALMMTGTFAGVNISFEGSLDTTNGTDGTWFSLQGLRTAGALIESTSGALSAVPAYAWEFGVAAIPSIRARCTAYTSGTAILTWKAGANSTEPAQTVGLAASQTLATVTTVATVTNVAAIGTSVTPGTAAANLGKARDAVAGGTDTGVATLLVRRDSPTALTPVAGDFESPQVDAFGSQWVHPVMGTTGGATAYMQISAATTNATSVKASAGTITSIVATNNHATTIAYLKIYNLAVAPTVGTSVPIAVYTLQALGGGVAINFPTGMALGTGIALSIQAGMATADTTAVAVSQVAVNLTYH